MFKEIIYTDEQYDEYVANELALSFQSLNSQFKNGELSLLDAQDSFMYRVSEFLDDIQECAECVIDYFSVVNYE